MKRKIIPALMIDFMVVSNGFSCLTVVPPKKPSNVPEKAFWAGGADGGSWFFIVSVKSKRSFRIRIYNDNDGELQIDTVFAMKKACENHLLDSAELIRSIAGFDGTNILLDIEGGGGKYCYLEER